jgi:hypothetical protein
MLSGRSCLEGGARASKDAESGLEIQRHQLLAKVTRSGLVRSAIAGYCTRLENKAERKMLSKIPVNGA